MSKLPSKNAFIVPVSAAAVEVAATAQKTLEQTIYETVERFIQTQSFRRISIIAGAGSVVIAAWYIIRKISSSVQSVPSSTPPSLAVEEIMAATVHQDHDHLVEAPPEDEKVVIHCCPRGYYTPCIATAPLHLETFLRVANIPYEVSFCSSANGHLTPFLTLGNKSAAEFRGCLRILGEKFDIDLEKDASASRKTASHLIDIMLENHFSWGILIWRWIYDEGDSLKKIQPISSVGEEVVGDVAAQIKEATRFQPISRLSKEEFVETLFQGLQDISAALGKHSFFMGQNPGVVDCNAFAVLAQMMWNMPDSPFEKQIRRYSNLVDFVTRMRDIYWPDWNQLIDKPEEYEALSMRDETVSRQASEERLKRRRSSRSRGRDSSQGCKVERILTPEDTEELRKRKLVDSPTVKSQIEKETESSNNSDAVPLEKTGDGSERKPTEVKNEKSESQRKEKVAPPESNNLTNLNNDTAAADTNSNSNVQPVGILKSGNAPDIIKQRSGIVNGSGANTNLNTGQEITPNSDPTVSNQKQQPQPSQQQVKQQPRQQQQAPAQRKSSPNNTLQQAEGQASKPQSQSQPLNKDSVFQVHKNSVKFADNATASVVFAMDEKAVKNIPEDTKTSPSYTISSTNESPSKKSTEIPVRTPNPEPAKKTIAVMLHDKQFAAKKGPVAQTQERVENNTPKKPEATAVDMSQIQSLRQQHYQQHLNNMNQTQQQQQKQVPSQQPPSQQQQFQPPRQQPSSPHAQQQQQHQVRQQQSAPQHPQQQTPNQITQQPPRRDTERAQSANAVNNNGIMSGPPQRPGNNYETYEMNGSLQMQENGQHMDADRNPQYYTQQRLQPMQQFRPPPYGRPAIYAQSHGAVFPPQHQIRYGPPMTPPGMGMGMYSQVPLEEYQKAQQAEAYYQDYHYPTGMLPASYMVADQMTPTMLQRFY